MIDLKEELIAEGFFSAFLFPFGLSFAAVRGSSHLEQKFPTGAKVCLARYTYQQVVYKKFLIRFLFSVVCFIGPEAPIG
jgi:hypothetical protein